MVFVYLAGSQYILVKTEFTITADVQNLAKKGECPKKKYGNRGNLLKKAYNLLAMPSKNKITPSLVHCFAKRITWVSLSARSPQHLLLID